MTKSEALERAEAHLDSAESRPNVIAEGNLRMAEAYIALAAQLSDEPVFREPAYGG